MMPSAYSAFLEQAPRCSLFAEHAERQYAKEELLFSLVVELMLAVVLRV